MKANYQILKNGLSLNIDKRVILFINVDGINRKIRGIIKMINNKSFVINILVNSHEFKFKSINCWGS